MKINRSYLANTVALGLIVTVGLLYGTTTAANRSKDNESNAYQPSTATDPQTSMVNPASTYCLEQKGTVQIKQDADGNESGLCVFPDGSSCDEWALYRSECKQGDSLPKEKVDITADTELISQALRQDAKVDLSKMKVIISEDTGTYASGSILPLDAEIGGACVYAARADGDWTIIAAGNGQINCQWLDPYPDFPTRLIPECVEKDGSNRLR